MIKRLVISGGGTGGHIFPALAIAARVKEKYPSCEILFIGAANRMEMQRIPAAGYRIIGLDIKGFNRKQLLKNANLPLLLLKALRKCRNILKEFQPDAVVGVGGYVSFVTLWTACNLQIPTLIQEQNSYPGLTNKILGKRVKVVCTAYEGLNKWFAEQKTAYCGNPVRKEIVNGIYAKPNEDTEIGNILVVGGSLGALSINEAIAANLPYFRNRNIQLVWQTGKWFYRKAVTIVEDNAYANVDVKEFIEDMASEYQKADLIISRAGALAVSELEIVGKPVIFIPSPNVTANHQWKNAKTLADLTAAELIDDADCKEKLADKIEALRNDKNLCIKMSCNISKLGIGNADEKIVEQIERIVK
ncbi:MAG: undecaprenyldiphospho-muramoylpentapeptide beta-N-acetylglucosaminyltransferase [Bacteroidales bacterium]|jgi:UDP-N-acetylglucosamine--N-acetylmuramyl-(pentapeptide) pyrophosphoryl-undecaprenol N-acetylglucosamine transferase|nr:undecaprenyldiphospho-muramoylpentapeptide beta-N-acetylglucosaminyltransferase [Bacteroidales bacterium]